MMPENPGAGLRRRNFLRGAVASAAVLPLGAALAACDGGDGGEAASGGKAVSGGSAATASANSGPSPRRPRGAVFDSEFLDVFGQWPVGYIPYGGADMGDVIAVADVVGDGDDTAFYNAWVAAGDTKKAQAEAALAKGHVRSARDLFLRSSCMYAAAYHPLFGKPVDPRLVAAFDKQMAVFQRGMELSDVPVHPVRIPYERTQLPAYLIPAVGHETERRPLVIFNNGYDATITDMYFASAVAATQRGYHALLFDGPGQGALLFKQGLTLRPDWEVVIKAVVDYAEKVPIVDAKKIALSGWSLGGYLAPRAATRERRLAACIADPGQWDIGDSIRALAIGLGISRKDVANLDDVDDKVYARLSKIIQGNRTLRWKIEQRGFWANGTPDLRAFVEKSARFTFKDDAAAIRCPTALTAAENDPLADATETFYDALTCPKQLLRFTAAEGAGGHTEAMNRSLLNQRVLDWLDDVLQPD